MKTYRRHRCRRQHKTAETFLKCAIRNLEWVAGDGNFALIAWCSVPTITLHPTLSEADEALLNLNKIVCGHACTGRHEVVYIDV